MDCADGGLGEEILDSRRRTSSALGTLNMKHRRIKYTDLNGKQKENYNFQKVAGVLADYGFNCMRLSDDWQGADFIAYHKDSEGTLRVQLKARLTVDKKYIGKGLHITFPIKGTWYLLGHDELIQIVKANANFLNTDSWITGGGYNSDNPNGKLVKALEEFALGGA